MKFFDFFPIPSYLKIPAVGFDVSDRSLKYVELRRLKKHIHPVAFGRKTIPPGLIEAGLIKKQDEFTGFLKSFRKELKNGYLIVALPEEKAFIGTIQLPLMKEEEVRGALELQLEEYVPFQAKEAVFDYEAIECLAGEKHFDISFTAAPLAVVQSYRDALVNAGFAPLVFETEPHALVRAFIRPEEKSAKMILDFGKTRTSFIIASGRKVEHSSTIKVAGETLDLALSKAFSISPEQGDRMKNEQGLIRTKESEKIFSVLLPIISAIKDEALRHLSYWKTHIDSHNQKNAEIEKIILCGGDSNLKGLPEYLSNELHLSVELGNPWINITSFEDYIPEIEFREALTYATALGLALRAV